MIIRCPFKGCNGTISLSREFDEIADYLSWDDRKSAERHKKCANCAWEEVCSVRMKPRTRACNLWQFIKPEIYKVRWLVHTILCPKCNNPVGNIDIGASFFCDWSDKDWHSEGIPAHEKALINDPKGRRGKHIKFEGKDVPNKYLKPWARTHPMKWKKVKKNG